MLVSATDPRLFLLDPRDIEHGRLPDHVRAYRAHAGAAVAWARAYLCRPHPALGRDGPVCPYTEISLERSLFWVTVRPGADATEAKDAAVLTAYGEWFRRLEPTGGKEAEYKAILILFPDLRRASAGEVIDALQRALKPRFTAEGLMIGQFYEGCEEPAIWNRDFHPLGSPVPLLAIRNMVRTDAPFLMKDAGSLAAYLRQFGDDVPSRLRSTVHDAALRLGLAPPRSGAGATTPSSHV
jgi:hypothetical protein